MRKKIFYMIVAVVLTTACNKDNEDGSKKITMTTSLADVSFSMAGSGTVTINWGDGSEIETHSLHEVETGWEYITHLYSHKYADASKHTVIVTINGTNITHFGCERSGLSVLDVRDCTTLDYINCSNNQLKSLDLSQNTQIRSINFINNQLTSIDVSKNVAMTILQCNNNQLKNLNLTHNTKLVIFNSSGNQFTNLDVNQNADLEIFTCYDNQITNLDLSNNRKLWYLVCEKNNLSSEALNIMFGTLHNYIITEYVIPASGKEVRIGDNPGTSSCDIKIAENKGWSVIR